MHRYLLLTLALAACVPDSGDEGLVILKNVAPSTECALTAQESEPAITHGELSSVFPTQYSFAAQIKSRISALAGQEDQRVVFATGANIDLTFPDSTFFSTDEVAAMKTDGITHFKSLFAAAISPNGGLTDASFEITTRELYDAIYAKSPSAKVAFGEPRFALEILATIKVIGTLGGDEVTSQPFAFPLRISNDGLVYSAGTCPLPAGTEFTFGNGCGHPQDAPIACCETMTGGLICPPTVETARL